MKKNTNTTATTECMIEKHGRRMRAFAIANVLSLNGAVGTTIATIVTQNPKVKTGLGIGATVLGLSTVVTGVATVTEFRKLVTEAFTDDVIDHDHCCDDTYEYEYENVFRCYDGEGNVISEERRPL